MPRPSIRRALLRSALAALALIAVCASAALADGIPTPEPGATTGPDSAGLKAVAAGHGLSCTDTTAPGFPPETSCVFNSADLNLFARFSLNPTLVMDAGATGTAPLPTQANDFLVDMTAPFCPPSGPSGVRRFLETSLAGPMPQSGWRYADDACDLQFIDSSASQPGGAQAVRTIIAWSRPGTHPTAGGGGGGAPPGSSDSPGAFARSVPLPDDVTFDPIVLAESLALAAAVVLLMPFPSQLFNSTLEEHYGEVRRWLRLDRIGSATGRLAAWWGTPAGIAVFVVISAVLYGLLDPGFGFSLESLGVLIGMAVAIVLTTVVFALPAILAHRRRGERGVLEPLPATLAVGAICVLVSRLTSFQPGYLYGLLIGISFAGELGEAAEGRSTALAAGLMLAIAVLAWLLLGVFSTNGTDVVGIAIETVLAATMVAGLEGVFFGLMPVRFLPGEKVFGWNRRVWAVLLGVGALAFFHILINPQSGYLSDTSRVPFLTTIALLVGFGGVSVLFWAYFRFRSAPSTSAEA